MRARDRDRGVPAVALLESAFHLLRRTPASLWLAFYAGTVPWVIAVLVYGAEMLGPGRWSVEGAALLAAGYLAMKAGQGVFARGLLRLAGGDRDPAPAYSTMRQAMLQPWSLLVLPVAFVVTLPFGWAYAYFQSLAVTGDPAPARRQAALWPRQNHVLLLLLGLVALVVFVNAAVSILIAPLLLERLAGIENVAARNPLGMLSWTTAALAVAAAYLAVAPLAKAAYALRCFHGEAQRGGEDLRAELERHRSGPAAALAIAMWCTAVALAGAVPATPESAQPAPAGAAEPVAGRTDAAQPGTLDAALDSVLARPEFAWRMPREEKEDDERGFFTPLFETLARWTRTAITAIDRLTSWLRRVFRTQPPSEDEGGGWSWIGSTYLWLGALAIALVIGGVLLLRRRRSPEPALAPAQPVVLDPLADAATAAATPAEEWLLRAEELLRAGDARHAVRALYLATLSLLAHRKLLLPERFKSNRDYLLEVRRRSRERPELADTFRAASDAFEGVWYGDHEATGDAVRSMRALHQLLGQYAS